MSKEKEWDPTTNSPGVYAYDSPSVQVQMHPMPGKDLPPDYHYSGLEYEDVYKEPYQKKSNESAEAEATGVVAGIQKTTYGLCAEYSKSIGTLITFLFVAAYTVYFVIACLYHSKQALSLIIMTGFAAFCFTYTFIKNHFGDKIWDLCLSPALFHFNKAWPYLKWIAFPLVIVALIFYIVFGVIKDIAQLQSLSGMVFFIGYLYLTSKHPAHINWRPVVVGFFLQFVFGILVLRWKPGYEAVKWFSDEVMTFINYALEGAAIVFGDPTMLMHPFVFVIMPMLIYIGAVMSILFYLGVTQVICSKIGWFMQLVLNTTAIETLSVSANIFLNGMDTMLMLRQYLPKLTSSEFHCFLVGNHATVAGFAFATFVMFGAPAEYLISASVMSAPASIAISKLNFPEVEESQTKTQADIQLDNGDETNVIEASANGASIAGKTVATVVVNYIGFLGLLGFINAFLTWFGMNVGFSELSFQWICSYMFWPMSVMMGVPPDEAREVSKLIGIKIFTSELLAYDELGDSITAGLSERSACIATYALCGFSSLSTLAIAVGVWQAVCPEKTAEMSGSLPRVIINANISCFLTACIAALMFDPDIITPSESNSELVSKISELLPSYKSLMSIVGM